MNTYNLQFDKLCDKLNLGRIISKPRPIIGGLLHKMYCVETQYGKYAIKALNPNIIIRPPAIKNYIDSENIAKIAKKYISAVAAKRFNDECLQIIDGQYYLIFDWIEGRSLKSNEITINHAKKMGALLADLHMIDFSSIDMESEANIIPIINWNFYLQKGKDENAVWYKQLKANIDKIIQSNTIANNSSASLASNLIISHGDMDSKNIMWHNDEPTIIDWESAGYTNPSYDIINTAIDWSKDMDDEIDKDKFLAFIRSYNNKCPIYETKWKAVLSNGYLLEWLEYNLKRSLMIECTDENEQRLGTEQVKGTIKSIIKYLDQISELEILLCKEFNIR